MAGESSSQGIPGIAVALATAGLIVAWSGVRNAGIVETLQSLAKGQKPTGHPVGPTTFNIVGQSVADAGANLQGAANNLIQGAISAGAGPNADIAAHAYSYVGRVPYKWGGSDPSGWDCSGMVYYVLHHDMGINVGRLVSVAYLGWSGATTIPRAQCAAGDLCVYPVGHVGIAMSNSEYVSAQDVKHGTATGKIDWSSVVIRRVNR